MSVEKLIENKAKLPFLLRYTIVSKLYFSFLIIDLNKYKYPNYIFLVADVGSLKTH